MDRRLALMCGVDIPVPECQLTVHQPKIKEIAFVGERDFFTGVQCLCVSKRMFTQDKTLLENTNNFQIFMTIMSEKETADKKEAVQQIANLFFPGYKMMFTPRSMLLQNEGGMLTIDESNFEILQDAISDICCLKTGPMDQSNFNPADERAKAIADKLMRGRQRVAAQKGDSNASVLTQYLSILTIGINSMSLEDLMELTIFQMYDLIERFSLFLNWDLDIRSRLAGGKPDSQPDNWMKSLH